MASCSRMHPSVTCSSFQTDRGAQRRPREVFRIPLPLMLTFALVCSLFCSVEVVAGDPKTGCVVTKGVTKCTCEKAEAEVLEATISAENNVLKLLCKEDMKCAPNPLTTTKVCPPQTTELKACKDEGDECIDLRTVLSGEDPKAVWKEDAEPSYTSRVLTVSHNNLPYVDGKFVVGCMNNTRDVTNCKVSVTVEARATDKTGQVITCAYGAKSNLARPSVTLSRSNNAFTLVCGKGGDVIPTNYEEAYCPPVSTDGKEALDTCAGNYATILPAYKPSWWSNKKEKTSYELSIPGDKFPEEEVTFVVGCRRASGEDAAKGTGSSAENPSVCYVDVRIEGNGKVSASHAPLVTGMFLGVSLATAGVVVFTSFVSRL